MYVHYPTKGHKESNKKGKGGRKWERVNAGNSRSDRLRLDWILDIHPRFIPRLKSYSLWSYCYDRLLPVYGSQRETRLGVVSRQLHWILALFVRYITQLQHCQHNKTLARHTEMAYAPRGSAPPTEAKTHQNWTRLIPGRHFRLSEMP